MAIITLYDIDEKAASDWAKENCSSFRAWLVSENQDEWIWLNIDDEPEWRVRYEFEFDDNHEAMMFQLRWQGQ